MDDLMSLEPLPILENGSCSMDIDMTDVTNQNDFLWDENIIKDTNYFTTDSKNESINNNLELSIPNDNKNEMINSPQINNNNFTPENDCNMTDTNMNNNYSIFFIQNNGVKIVDALPPPQPINIGQFNNTQQYYPEFENGNNPMVYPMYNPMYFQPPEIIYVDEREVLNDIRRDSELSQLTNTTIDENELNDTSINDTSINDTSMNETSMNEINSIDYSDINDTSDEVPKLELSDNASEDLTILIKLEPNMFDSKLLHTEVIHPPRLPPKERSKLLIERAFGIKLEQNCQTIENKKTNFDTPNITSMPMTAQSNLSYDSPLGEFGSFWNKPNISKKNSNESEHELRDLLVPMPIKISEQNDINENNYVTPISPISPRTQSNIDLYGTAFMGLDNLSEISSINDSNTCLNVSFTACESCYKAKKKCVKLDETNEFSTCQNCEKKGLNCVPREDRRSKLHRMKNGKNKQRMSF